MWTEFADVINDHPLWTPRFHAWLCQAHLNLHQPKEALRHCYTGIRLAKAIDDAKGVIVGATDIVGVSVGLGVVVGLLVGSAVGVIDIRR